MVRISCSRVEGAVSKKNQEQIAGGIDPDLGTGEAGVTVGRVADKGAVETRLIVVELRSVPAEEAGAAVCPSCKESLHRRRADPLALGAYSSTEPDLSVMCQVHAGREDPRMSRGTAEDGGVGIVYLSLNRVAPPEGSRH